MLTITFHLWLGRSCFYDMIIIWWWSSSSLSISGRSGWEDAAQRAMSCQLWMKPPTVQHYSTGNTGQIHRIYKKNALEIQHKYTVSARDTCVSKKQKYVLQFHVVWETRVHIVKLNLIFETFHGKYFGLQWRKKGFAHFHSKCVFAEDEMVTTKQWKKGKKKKRLQFQHFRLFKIFGVQKTSWGMIRGQLIVCFLH